MKATLFPCLYLLHPADLYDVDPREHGWVTQTHISEAKTKQALLSHDVTIG